LIFLFCFFALSEAAWASPEHSAIFEPGRRILPCSDCHISNLKFEKNIYIDIRLATGESLVDSHGVAHIPWEAGETLDLVIVLGLEKQDLEGKASGWFINLPAGSTLWPGELPYGYRRINYEKPGEFTADGAQFRAWSGLKLTFGREPPGAETELWAGVGAKATDKYPGSTERRRTLGLRRLLIKWVESRD